MKCIVISLQEAEERRTAITTRFQEVGLPFEFFDAVGTGDLDKEIMRFVDREGRERLGIYRLDDGSVACLLSHLEVLFELVESGEDMVAIFEDDAVLHPDLPAILATLEGKADRFDVVKLQRRNSTRPYFPVYSLTDAHTLGRVKYHDRGADGYVITRSAAGYLRNRYPRPIHEIDWIIPKFWDSGLQHVYYLDPPVVFHDDDGPSQIRNSRDEELPTIGRIAKQPARLGEEGNSLHEPLHSPLVGFPQAKARRPPRRSPRVLARNSFNPAGRGGRSPAVLAAGGFDRQINDLCGIEGAKRLPSTELRPAECGAWRGAGCSVAWLITRNGVESTFLPESSATGQPARVGDRMLACLSASRLTHREARVLAVIAYHDGPGGAWPSAETIMRESGLPSRARVFETIVKLEEKSVLVRERGRFSNVYRIRYDRLQCPGKADSDKNDTVSGFDSPHCPGKADGNRKEPGRAFPHSATGQDCERAERCNWTWTEPEDRCACGTRKPAKG